MVGALVFLTPYAGFVALAALLPFAASLLAAAQELRARRLLRLPAPPPARRLPRLLGLLAVPALLGLAATQPSLRSSHRVAIRTDAEAMFVIDTSRSMLAAASPTARSRFERAQTDALEIRNALPQIPSGVATFTDRVLPDLLPDSDPAVFDSTVTNAVGINEPPPSADNVVATTLDGLAGLGTGNYFPPSATKRLAIVLTDGETRPYNPRQVAHDLSGGPGIDLILIHIWAPGERVYDNGHPELAYHEDPQSGEQLQELAQAAGGAVFPESDIQGAIARALADLGTGPTRGESESEHTSTLAPYVALVALLPLLALIWIRGGRASWRRALRPELAAALGGLDGRERRAREPAAAPVLPAGTPQTE